MSECVISRVSTYDARYPLADGAGSDAVHINSEYGLAVARIHTTSGVAGTGFALTLGEGNNLVCEAIGLLAPRLRGKSIEDLMAGFGVVAREMADDAKLRWLGPHKGVVHLALAAITNACFDLWAKNRGVPLWQLLLSLSPDELVCVLDLSYLDDILNSSQARELLAREAFARKGREAILHTGYPGYDTSIGWLAYDDTKVKELTRRSLDEGFRAVKLKVGSTEPLRDISRATMLRECIGNAVELMFDANQQWTLSAARRMCRQLGELHPLWIEEPMHPDDLVTHATLAREIAPIKIAAGEHIPNRIVFKNFMEAAALHYVQADCTRLGGVSEFLTVSLLARQLNLPVVPHAGDMGQVHQHLAIFNHIALGHPVLYLEYIPHLRSHFVFPAQVEGGNYRTPEDPGASTDLIALVHQN